VEKITVTIKYLGFNDQLLDIECPSGVKQDFTVEMERSSFRLDEIVISEKFPAIIEKRDTIIFNASDFTTGTESKLKELLNRLPGIHVDRENIVTYNGERVQQILVDKEKF